jgi:hypothetical protein
VLIAKGGELRPKQLDQLPLAFFQNFSVSILVFYQSPFIAKTALLWGRNLIMGRRESFWLFDQNKS